MDSGLPPNYKQFPVCAAKDFTDTGIVDDLGHGTNITNVITKDLDKTQYCIVMAKVFSSKVIGTAMENILQGLVFLYEENVDIVNLSLGSLGGVDAREHFAVKFLMDNGIVVVAAAGNNGKNLDEDCNYYPACYDSRIIVVGNGFNNYKKAPTSNYGTYVKVWHDGQDVCAGGICQSGTSQATAKETNKQVRRMLQSEESESYKEAAFRTGEALIKYNHIDENLNTFGNKYTEPLDKKLQIYLKRMPAGYQKSVIILYNLYEIVERKKVVITYGF